MGPCRIEIGIALHLFSVQRDRGIIGEKQNREYDLRMNRGWFHDRIAQIGPGDIDLVLIRFDGPADFLANITMSRKVGFQCR